MRSKKKPGSDLGHEPASPDCTGGVSVFWLFRLFKKIVPVPCPPVLYLNARAPTCSVWTFEVVREGQ